MARSLWVSARVACTAGRGQGATVFSPLTASPAGVRVSVTFSSRRPPKRLFRLPATPVQNRRRPGRPFIKGECAFRDGLPNCSFSMPFFRGYPKPHISCSSVSPGDPEPPAKWSLRASLRFFKVDMRRNGGGFAPPTPSQSRATASAQPFHREHCDPVTQQMYQRCIRLDASPSSR